MLTNALKKIFGSANDRALKQFRRTVEKINALEKSISALSDEALAAKTIFFKEELVKGKTLDDILPEVFAVVRETSKRVLGMRHFDVQLIGGMVLHQGMIAEMRTGEGKTLVATLPVYLNALTGKGVHVVTINDYLAKRDAEWNGPIYEFLGLSVGCIVHGLRDDERREMYACDITYGTNHEYGFDYLRDNMKFHKSEMVQRKFFYAVVDEIDNILIDEARTPLIISGPAEDSSQLYIDVDKIIPQLVPTDYEVDEKQRTTILTENGTEHIESLLKEASLLKGDSLYDVQNISLVHHVNQALRAHKLFTKDVDYIVKNKKVIIIDEFTGRIMDGRRYSEGLHQALEAKEHVPVEMENQTLASITYQNFFRLYEKLSGMSGTVLTEADEFEEIYKLKSVAIPTNVPIKRIDHEDDVYLTEAVKFEAVIKQIKECMERRQPVLVGTASIEKSEILAALLKAQDIPHKVLNAKYHEQEAEIIADAGRSGTVTIATNMAGRGTDIKLGGNLEMRLKKSGVAPESPDYEHVREEIIKEIAEDAEIVRKAGGLCVIGTERHESRRIDNQLRGRGGRQGDPSSSKFYVSLQDPLMRIFGSERMTTMLKRFGAKDNEAITHKWVTKSLERAQGKVEARNFDSRKNVLKYDDVMNEQRRIVYGQRFELMESADDKISETVNAIRDEVLDELLAIYIPMNSLPEQWDLEGLENECYKLLNLQIPVQKWGNEDGIAASELKQRIAGAQAEQLQAMESNHGTELIRNAERTLLLRILDHHWKENLATLDHLRQAINLRAYAQGNPLNEYKREAFIIFNDTMRNIKFEFVRVMGHFELHMSDGQDLNDVLNPEMDFSQLVELLEGQEITPEFQESLQQMFSSNLLSTNPEADLEKEPNRNSMCYCGSGKKYKHCHGKISVGE